MPLLAPSPVGGGTHDPALAQDAQMNAAFERASMARAESYQTFVRGLPSLADEADVSGLLDPTRITDAVGKSTIIRSDERLSSGRRKKGSAPVHPAPAHPIPAHLAGIMRDADVDALAAAASRSRSQSHSQLTTTEAEFHAERARLADFARALEDYIRTPADDFLEQRRHAGGGAAGASGAAGTVGAGGRGGFIMNDDDDDDDDAYDENEAMIRAFQAAAMAGDADYYAPSLHNPPSPAATAATGRPHGGDGGGLDEDGIEEEAIDQGQTPFFLESPKMAGDTCSCIHVFTTQCRRLHLDTALSMFFFITFFLFLSRRTTRLVHGPFGIASFGVWAKWSAHQMSSSTRGERNKIAQTFARLSSTAKFDNFVDDEGDRSVDEEGPSVGTTRFRST